MSVSLPATLGPRNRRRIAIGAGVGLAVTGAVVAAVLLTLPAGRSGREAGLARAENGIAVTHPDGIVTITPGITAGWSPQQVQRLLGKPTTKQGHCWQYPAKTDPYFAAYGVKKTVLDMCFFAGRVSDTSTKYYVRRNGKLVLWHPPQPRLP
jgi:hypothetical protein